MKKILLTALSFLSLANFNAQISLSYSVNSPIAGEAYLVDTYDTTSAINLSLGANQAWDFSTNTVSANNSYPVSYQAASSYVSSPAGSNLIESRNTQKYFLKTSSSKMEVIGYSDASNSFHVPESEAITYRNWPMNFGDNYIDTGDGFYTTSVQNLPSNGSLSPNAKGRVSGYGTLKVPDGTIYNNVLLVVDTIAYDISYAPSSGVLAGLGTTVVSYKFYSATKKFPVLNFTFTTSTQYAFNLSPFQTLLWNVDKLLDIEYNKSESLSSLEENSSLALGVYPNPSSDLVNVALKESANIQLIDVNGTILNEIFMNEGLNQIDMSHYTQGVYFLHSITTEGKTAVVKLIKE
jgi:hypothetical protein